VNQSAGNDCLSIPILNGYEMLPMVEPLIRPMEATLKCRNGRRSLLGDGGENWKLLRWKLGRIELQFAARFSEMVKTWKISQNWRRLKKSLFITIMINRESVGSTDTAKHDAVLGVDPISHMLVLMFLGARMASETGLRRGVAIIMTTGLGKPGAT
jgi:hypothetical protein